MPGEPQPRACRRGEGPAWKLCQVKAGWVSSRANHSTSKTQLTKIRKGDLRLGGTGFGRLRVELSFVQEGKTAPPGIRMNCCRCGALNSFYNVPHPALRANLSRQIGRGCSTRAPASITSLPNNRRGREAEGRQARRRAGEGPSAQSHGASAASIELKVERKKRFWLHNGIEPKNLNCPLRVEQLCGRAV
jgi:hypothetical protein